MINLETLSKRLLMARERRKALEEEEKQLRQMIQQLWGPTEVKSESRIFGKMRLTARRQTRLDFKPLELRAYLTSLGKPELFEEVSEVKVSRKKVESKVKKEELPEEVMDLAYVSSEYIVWVPEELEE